MTKEFELCTENPPFITISPGREARNCILCFNTKTYEVLGDPAYVALYFDVENRRFGIKSALIDSESGRWAYVIEGTKALNHFIIRAATFINYYHLPRCDKLPLYQEDDLFVADLPKKE